MQLCRVLVVPALLATLAGCGDDGKRLGDAPKSSTTASTSGPDDTVTSPPASSEPGTPTEPGAAQLVEPRPGMAGARPQAFESAEPVEGGTALLVRYWSGVAPCSVLDRVEVTETDTTVTVTLYVGSDPAKLNAVCIELAALYEVQVALATPLGDREVIDGAAASDGP